MITFGSLFSGIGGIDLGFERAGMACQWQVEINPFAQKVLAKHWPDVPKFGDIHDVGKHNLKTVDVIAGGFPCQPHSVAGKRKGATDDRNLWPEYLRIVQELKPTWVIGENVPGIITTYLDQVLLDLENEGYEVQTLSVPACAFDAPHIRERVFILARHVADAKSVGRRTRSAKNDGQVNRTSDAPANSGQDVAHSKSGNAGQQEAGNWWAGTSGRSEKIGEGIKWEPEPRVGRVVNGLSVALDGTLRKKRNKKAATARRNRIRGLGNAVVPQVAQFIGEALVNTIKETE